MANEWATVLSNIHQAVSAANDNELCHTTQPYNCGVLPTEAAAMALDAVPDGWAKVDGEWVLARRCYENVDTLRPTNEWVVIGPPVKWPNDAGMEV